VESLPEGSGLHHLLARPLSTCLDKYPTGQPVRDRFPPCITSRSESRPWFSQVPSGDCTEVFDARVAFEPPWPFKGVSPRAFAFR